MPGYSGAPLAKKLGIKAGARVALVETPRGFEALLEGLPEGARVARGLRGSGPIDVIVWAPPDAAALTREIRQHERRLAEAGGLWLCWPKKSSGVRTDLTESLVRETGLAAGLVDNKVCAVTDVLSGLRFVRRLKDRGGANADSRSKPGDPEPSRRRLAARAARPR